MKKIVLDIKQQNVDRLLGTPCRSSYNCAFEKLRSIYHFCKEKTSPRNLMTHKSHLKTCCIAFFLYGHVDEGTDKHHV